MNVILSYRESPFTDQLKRCGGIKLIVKKVDLCEFLSRVKKLGFNEVLYYKWMDDRNTWHDSWEEAILILEIMKTTEEDINPKQV
ncbi:hypothetical protein LCGC14_1096600 [marine sediment metagenome]|uniref:Uncharacterized protein n=1 Tax=marine sediment metagenome TaxID=412755 RepID=A0A0F9QGU2_9ZZZZ